MIDKLDYLYPQGTYQNYSKSKVFDNFKYHSYPHTISKSLHQDSFYGQNLDNLNSSLSKAIGIGSGFAGILLAAANYKKIKNWFVLKKQINCFKKQMSEYPRDIDYRKALAKNIDLPSEQYYKLRPVIGPDEFTAIVKNLSTDVSIYSPGTKSYHHTGEAQFLNLENVKNRKFGANMHMHTLYSDGHMSVSELLEQAADYADKRAKSTRKPFVIGITDHDTVEGCKKAIEIIKQNPFKYKNLRVVMGIENTTLFKNENLLNEPVHIHLLAYGLDPYSKDIDVLLTKKIKKNIKNIKSAILNANIELKDVIAKNNFRYEFSDFEKMVPNINHAPISANYYIKDFLQFRLVFANLVENNPALKDFLKSQNISINKIDFSTPIKYIPKNPDYSNGQTYWGYYCDALKSLIVDTSRQQNSSVNSSQILPLFKKLPDYLKNCLYNIETLTQNPHESVHVKKMNFPYFEDTVYKLSNFEHGLMGIAHPGVFFPKNALKNKNNIVKLYEEVYKIFKKIGKSKAAFAEDNYQVYFENFSKELLTKFSDISTKYGLLKTGGIDTHAKNIFISKY